MNVDEEYLESKVMTARPHQLHLMAVDGAIRFATRAQESLKTGNFERAHLSLNSSRGLVAELISGLDPDHAPEMVSQLKALFLFVYRCLVEADLQHDSHRADDAIRVLRLHRDTWAALSEQLDREPPGREEQQGRESVSWSM